MIRNDATPSRLELHHCFVLSYHYLHMEKVIRNKSKKIIIFQIFRFGVVCSLTSPCFSAMQLLTKGGVKNKHFMTFTLLQYTKG